MKLNFFHPTAQWPDGDLERKLTGHLNARIGEYEGYGLHVLGPQDLGYQPQGVWVTFTALSDDQAAQQLETRFHIAHHRSPQGPIGFTPSPQTRFEEIDHLQGAIDALVGGY